MCGPAHELQLYTPQPLKKLNSFSKMADSAIDTEEEPEEFLRGVDDAERAALAEFDPNARPGPEDPSLEAPPQVCLLPMTLRV